MHEETGKLTTSLVQLSRFILLLFLDSWFLEFSASFDGLLELFSCEIIESSKSQIDPFSPIRNATDFGSIHSVSSSGRVRSLLGRPLAWAASAITGSREWLILMQRNPLPNKGFWGCQWCLYLAHKISFIFLWNDSSCFSESFPFPLNIFVTNLHAISTSAFIFYDSISSNSKCLSLSGTVFLFRIPSRGILFKSERLFQQSPSLSTTSPKKCQPPPRTVPSLSKSQINESPLLSSSKFSSHRNLRK